MHLPSKQILLYLPKCRSKIQRNQEGQEEYWARKVVWVVQQVQARDVILTWRKVRDLTNMRRKDFEACLPYISEYAEGEIAEKILRLL